MGRFKYRVIDRKGKTSEGVATAANVASLALLLKGQGQFLVSAVPAAEPKPAAPPVTAKAKKSRRARPPKVQEILIFNSQLALMVRSAVPILDAMMTLASQQSNPRLREVLFDICDGIKNGQTLSSSFARHPDAFDKVYCSLLEAGESGGSLSRMLERLTAYLQFSESVRTRMKSALVYPVVVMGTAFLIVFLLLIFVLPTFSEVFEQFDAPLPMITQVLLWLSASLRGRWYVWLGAAASVFLYARRRLRSPAHAAERDRIILNLPIIGPLVKNIVLARAFRTLGELLKGNVPILKAITLSRDAANNSVFAKALDETAASVSSGQGVAAALSSCEDMPEMVPHLILTAEKSGRLPEALLFISDFFEQQIDVALRDLFAALEPVFVVFLGVCMGTIALAMLLPVFELGGLVN